MESIPQELLNFEQQLQALQPLPVRTSPEQLLYQAGWEAALAQHTVTASVSPAASIQRLPRPRANHYCAAACAVLLLLSTALGWQVWQQPQLGLTPNTATTVPATPHRSASPAPALAITAPAADPEEPRFAEIEPSALASYLELRHRVTRGGLSMWSVSTPGRVAPNDGSQAPARDWQAELLREAL